MFIGVTTEDGAHMVSASALNLFAVFLIHWATHTFCTAVATVITATRIVVSIVADFVSFISRGATRLVLGI